MIIKTNYNSYSNTLFINPKSCRVGEGGVGRASGRDGGRGRKGRGRRKGDREGDGWSRWGEGGGGVEEMGRGREGEGGISRGGGGKDQRGGVGMGSRRGGWGEGGGTGSAATTMGVGGCSIGVKRLPEIGDDGGDRDGDVVFCEEVSSLLLLLPCV